MSNENEAIINLIKDLKSDLHISMDKIEKKIDDIAFKQDKTNERAIVNSASIFNLKEDISEKSIEFMRQINILHKVNRDCKLDHSKCPENVLKSTKLEVQNWFYKTWVVGAAGIILSLTISLILKFAM